MKHLLLIALFATTAGCASMWDKPLAARVGLHIDDVIGQMGYPDSERRVAGRHIYEWKRQSVGAGVQLQCTATYEVNAAGIVVDYDWHGQTDACLQFTR